MVEDPQIELWVEDEVFFQLFGTICKMWIPPEDFDPFVLHNPVKKNAKYYGAVRVRDGKFVYQRIMGMFDGDNFFTFLKYLRKITARSSKKTVILLDGAPYHRAKVHKEWRDSCSDKFCLEFLPPYRESVEIYTKKLYAQQVFSHHRGYSCSCGVTIRSMGAWE
jgi:hypothetical protein